MPSTQWVGGGGADGGAGGGRSGGGADGAAGGSGGDVEHGQMRRIVGKKQAPVHSASQLAVPSADGQ